MSHAYYTTSRQTIERLVYYSWLKRSRCLRIKKKTCRTKCQKKSGLSQNLTSLFVETRDVWNKNSIIATVIAAPTISLGQRNRKYNISTVAASFEISVVPGHSDDRLSVMIFAPVSKSNRSGRRNDSVTDLMNRLHYCPSASLAKPSRVLYGFGVI